MRVAYLINQYPAPTHAFIRREIAALEAQGTEILRFTVRRSSGPLTDEVDMAEKSRTRAILEAGKAAITLRAIGTLLARPKAAFRALGLAIRLGWRSQKGLLRHLAYFAEACTLADWLKENGAEHLHAHFGTNPAMVAMLCRALGGPRYSFTAHGPEEFDRAEMLVLAEKVKRAAFVVGVCDFGRSQLFRWSRPKDWPKINVVRCGLDPDLLKAPLNFAQADPQLACVARLSEQKGQLLLLEASAQLKKEGISFRLLLVGDGPMRGRLEQRIHELDLLDRVRLTGWLGGNQIREIILASRALLLPSFAEGLPVVLMESLALGRPVIATYVAGIPELVEPSCGWLVPAGSVDALAEAMRAVLRAPSSQLEEMGRAGARLVASRHDAFQEAAKLADLFRQQINGRNAASGFL